MIITYAWLQSIRTAKGGWTREQFAVLGILWPPHRGWARKVIGQRISNAEAERIKALGEEPRGTDAVVALLATATKSTIGDYPSSPFARRLRRG